MIPDIERLQLVREVLIRRLTEKPMQPLEFGQLIDHLLEELSPHLRHGWLRSTRCALSDREVEVVELVAQGMSNAEVGAALHLSGMTVKSHLARICKRTGARTRAHIVAIAYQEGVLR